MKQELLAATLLLVGSTLGCGGKTTTEACPPNPKNALLTITKDTNGAIVQVDKRTTIPAGSLLKTPKFTAEVNNPKCEVVATTELYYDPYQSLKSMRGSMRINGIKTEWHMNEPNGWPLNPSKANVVSATWTPGGNHKVVTINGAPVSIR